MEYPPPQDLDGFSPIVSEIPGERDISSRPRQDHGSVGKYLAGTKNATRPAEGFIMFQSTPASGLILNRHTKSIIQGESMSEKSSGKHTKYLEVIESVPFADFSTIDKDGFPSTRLMMNLRNEGQFPACGLYEKEKPLTVFLTTHRTSEKMDEIRRNPKSSVYFFNPATFGAVLLIGEVTVVTDEVLRKEAWQKDWETHYPDAEDYVLLRFVPSKLKAAIGGSTATENL
jgi:general stress protein 26